MWSRLCGLAATIALINRWADRLRLAEISLDDVSERVERAYARYRFLFVARRQKCLIRGFLIFFYAKRARMDIRLIFGAADDGKGRPPKWHCWIVADNEVKYEMQDVIDTYTPFIEYR